MLTASVLKPLNAIGIAGQKETEPGMQHYMCPDGLSSISKHFIKQSGKHTALCKQNVARVSFYCLRIYKDKYYLDFVLGIWKFINESILCIQLKYIGSKSNLFGVDKKLYIV